MKATLRKDGGKFVVVDPRPGKGIAGTFDAKDVLDAVAMKDQIDDEIAAAEAASSSTAGPKVVVKNGKMTLTASGLGYKGQLFGGYVADWEALCAYFGAPADSQARKDLEANRAKLCATWQAYGDLPVGAILPSGEAKPASKSK